LKVQQIKKSVSLSNLEDWGLAGPPGTSSVRTSGVQRAIAGQEQIDTGVFECSAGTYRRVIMRAEVMHILSGRGRFTPDGEDTIHFEAGDTMFFEVNTEGRWEIDETMRKVYVII